MVIRGYSKRKLRQIKKSCACRDCGKHGGLYMLKTRIWLQVWPTYFEDMKRIKDPTLRHGMICFRCAQKHLGREFKSSDFMPGVPCNDIIFYFMFNKSGN